MERDMLFRELKNLCTPSNTEGVQNDKRNKVSPRHRQKSYHSTPYPPYEQREMQVAPVNEVLKAIQSLEADYLSTTPSKKPMWLEYNGQELKVFIGKFKDKTQSVLFRAWAATSGLLGSQHSSYQADKDKGPVPEGIYKVSLTSSFLRKAPISSSTCSTIGSLGVSFLPWEDNQCRFYGWGQWRARLESIKRKNLAISRNNFYFHDSYKGYSHGCVETETDLLYLLCVAKKHHHHGDKNVVYVHIDYTIDSMTKGSTDGATFSAPAYKPWKYFWVSDAIAIPDIPKTKAELKAFYKAI